MSNLITLTCPSCGGRLEVTDEAERYICAHCGNSHVVDTIEQTVRLKAQVESLTIEKQIRHLQDEIAKLKTQRYQLRSELAELQNEDAPRRKQVQLYRLGIVVGPIIVIIGLRILTQVGTADKPGGAFFMVVGAAMFVLALTTFFPSTMRANIAVKKMARDIVSLDQVIARRESELNALQNQARVTVSPIAHRTNR
jgi:predicted RNA-binding Zn-ribbon protein involved in translation (DUF1610 family)